MPIPRANYFDRQFLRPQDLNVEQDYHVAMHRRHNLAAHIWGIVYGLEVVKDATGNLAVQPGLAVDGYGRDLVLPYPQTISPKVFDEKGSERLEVWLKYGRLASDPAVGGYAGCDIPAGVLPGAPGYKATRTQELAVVVLQPPDPNLVAEIDLSLPERRQPPEVPTNDIRFDPTRLPPDDPARSWPVFLGLLRRLPGQPPSVTIDLSGRPYAGLVGEMVRAPSGQAWMQVGSELQADPYRFAVYLPETEGQTADRCYGAFPMGLEPRLGVTKDGEIRLRGDTNLEGDLTVDGGSIEFGVGPALARPRPWRIYHAQGHSDPLDPNSTNLHQLRIEMDTPPSGNPTGKNQVSIGVWSAKQNSFVPCLTVDDRCVVTVHGNLFVEGRMDPPILTGNEALSTEARSAVTGLMMSSLSQRLNKLTDQLVMEISPMEMAAPAGAESVTASAVREAAAVATTPSTIRGSSASARLPQLDAAMQEVIRVLSENTLMGRFVSLLSKEPGIKELVKELGKSRTESDDAGELHPPYRRSAAPVAPSAVAVPAEKIEPSASIAVAQPSAGVEPASPVTPVEFPAAGDPATTPQNPVPPKPKRKTPKRSAAI